MKRSMRTSLLAALLVSAVALPAVALADRENSRGDRENSRGESRSESRGRGNARSIPEFDVAAVGAIAAVIAGGGIVLARRRRKS